MQCASPFLGILGTNKHGCEQQTTREFQASSIQSACSLPVLQEKQDGGARKKIYILQPSQRIMHDHVDGMALFIRARLNLNCVSTTPHQPSGQAKARLAAGGRRGEAVDDSPSSKCPPFLCLSCFQNNNNNLECSKGNLAERMPNYVAFGITSTGRIAPQMQLCHGV
jgi:hypothetical protein